MQKFAIVTGKWEVILHLLTAMVLLSNLIMRDGMSFAATGAWTSNGPEGGQIKTLSIDPVTPNNLYAGTSGGGVFRSFNGGNTWNPANTGLTNYYVNSVAIDPATPFTIHAGTSGVGVQSWTIPAVPPPKPESVVPSPENGQVTIAWSEVAEATSYNLY